MSFKQIKHCKRTKQIMFNNNYKCNIKNNYNHHKNKINKCLKIKLIFKIQIT